MTTELKCYYATRPNLQGKRICQASWECQYSDWRDKVKYCKMTEEQAREMMRK